MYTPVESSRLYEKVVEQIQSLIISGDLAPGVRLPSERELAEQFEVSRTVVREAVKTLREKRLVEVRRGLGTFVTDLADGTKNSVLGSLDLLVKIDEENGFHDLLQVRTILEPPMTAMATETATAEELKEMEEAIAEMDEALARGDRAGFVAADMAFHLVLARATGNSLLPILLNAIVELLNVQRERVFTVAGGPERGQHHHRQILAAVQARDPVAARAAMEAHLQQVIEDIRAAPP